MSNAAVTNAKTITMIGECVKTRLFYLQIGAPMRRCKDPPPGPTGRRCRLCHPKTRRLGVRGRGVTSRPVASDRRDVRTTARPSDQRGRGLLFLVVVVGDPDEPTTLWSLAALCWQHLCRGRIHRQWPFPRYPILGGRGGAVLLLLTVGVLRTPSSVALWRVHPRRIFHTRC